jgi:hypothetical protein
MDLVNNLVWLHEVGLRHCDISEDNVLDNDGLPFIIDLEHAVTHTCGLKMSIQQGELRPRQSEFDCDELYILCDDTKIWSSGTALCLSSCVGLRG